MGEIHNRPEHHLGQLAVIRALHDHGVDLAVGLEAFQRHLDGYIAAYNGHGQPEQDATSERLRRCLDIQMLWDEPMAEAAAAYPEARAVRLALRPLPGYAPGAGRRRIACGRPG